MAFDCFISYAFEDKEALAQPLALELKGRDWSVWIAESELRVGDNLSARVNTGLDESRMVVMILSPAFFGKSWPRRELAAVMSREAFEHRALIVPVLHVSRTRFHGDRFSWFPI